MDVVFSRSPVLSEQQVSEFSENGYVIVREAFDSKNIETIQKWVTEVSEMPERVGYHWVFHEKSILNGESLINRIEYIRKFHKGFEHLTQILSEPASQVFGEDVVLFKEKINFKMPGGDGFKPHQDSQAGWEEYASNFVNVMICADDCTLENGCLELVPGHNKRGLLRGMEPLTEDDTRDMEFIKYPMKKGDIALFDSYVPHKSEKNLSEDKRRVYFATYNSKREGDHLEKYYSDKRKNFPPDIERVSGKEYVYKV
jgi:ectoine hydroxylase-related dioxygenase (phytanoyl-CoA dioxygenase family)